jgi:hypothetical protein
MGGPPPGSPRVFTVTDGKVTQITNYAGDQQAKDAFFS